MYICIYIYYMYTFIKINHLFDTSDWGRGTLPCHSPRASLEPNTLALWLPRHKLVGQEIWHESEIMPCLLSLLGPMAHVFQRVQGLKSTGNSCICYEENIRKLRWLWSAGRPGKDPYAGGIDVICGWRWQNVLICMLHVFVLFTAFEMIHSWELDAAFVPVKTGRLKMNPR